MKFLIVILFIIGLQSCSNSDNNNLVSSSSQTTQNDNLTTLNYHSIIVINPNEMLDLNSNIIGFISWRNVNIYSNVELEIRVNNQETILQFTELSVKNIRWESAFLINHSDVSATVEIFIVGRTN